MKDKYIIEALLHTLLPTYGNENVYHPDGSAIPVADLVARFCQPDNPPARLPRIIVDGYWRDDRTEFEGYVVSQTHDVEEDDDSIFFYGLSESEIAESLGKETAQDFVITAYEVANY